MWDQHGQRISRDSQPFRNPKRTLRQICTLDSGSILEERLPSTRTDSRGLKQRGTIKLAQETWDQGSQAKDSRNAPWPQARNGEAQERTIGLAVLGNGLLTRRPPLAARPTRRGQGWRRSFLPCSSLQQPREPVPRLRPPSRGDARGNSSSMPPRGPKANGPMARGRQQPCRACNLSRNSGLYPFAGVRAKITVQPNRNGPRTRQSQPQG